MTGLADRPAERAAPAGVGAGAAAGHDRASHRILWPVARWALNVAVVIAGVVAAAWVVVQLRLVVVPALIALLVAALLMPAADLLRRRLPSPVAALAVMLGGVGLIAGAVALVAPSVVDQADDLGRSVRDGLDDVLVWLSEGPLGVERAQVETAVEDALARAGEAGLSEDVLAGTVLLGEVVAGALLAVVLVFFVLSDGRRLWSWGVALLPARRRARAECVGADGWAGLSGYVRGVVVVAVVDAVLIGIALAVIGVPLVLPLMVLTFLGAFLPLVGAVLAGAVAALVALVTVGPVAALLVVVAVVVIQQLEGDLLYPLVVGRAVALHPVAILLALTAGTVLAGVIGALLAVPAASATWTLVSDLRSGDDTPTT